ncbi:MAG: hypothetical protein JSU63_12255 [Phycisphaerales bacterium]|nr:MAG: hypothetical protein JSU63_12255 [Phycisphaerales bacterium]
MTQGGKQTEKELKSGQGEEMDDATESSEATSVDKPEEKAAPATPKKPLGAKEVVPFEWKLVGEAQGMILTLFKAVEHPEVEAQLERISKDGYYSNLRILEADTKIVQPKPPTPPKKPTRRVRETRKTAGTTKAKKARKKTTKKRAAKKKTEASSAKTLAKKATKKTATKKTRKKTTSAKEAKKTAAPKPTKKTTRKKK